MNLDEIKKAVKEWSEIRTSPGTVVNYLNQGGCFLIEKSQYDLWKKNSPKNLYVYFGIFSGNLKLVLTDTILDGDLSASKDSIFVTDYLSGLNLSEGGFIEKAIDGDISVIEALKKTFRWNIFMEAWVYEKVNTPNGIFEAFRVPFTDLTSQFDKSACTKSLVVLGLNADNQADLVLWGLHPASDTTSELNSFSLTTLEGTETAPVADLATPCPPFS